MQKMVCRTVTVGTTLLLILASIVLIGAPSQAEESDYLVDGMDGLVTIYDGYGSQMTVPADCAALIVHFTEDNLEELHKNGLTATPEYVEACF